MADKWRSLSLLAYVKSCDDPIVFAWLEGGAPFALVPGSSLKYALEDRT